MAQAAAYQLGKNLDRPALRPGPRSGQLIRRPFGQLH